MIALCTKLRAGASCCQAPTVGPSCCNASASITVLPMFHPNRTKCLAKPCKNMYIKLSPCCQGGKVYLFSSVSLKALLRSNTSWAWTPSGVAEICLHSTTLILDTQMLGLVYALPKWRLCLGKFRINQIFGPGSICREEQMDRMIRGRERLMWLSSPCSTASGRHTQKPALCHLHG